MNRVVFFEQIYSQVLTFRRDTCIATEIEIRLHFFPSSQRNHVFC